VSIGQVMSEPLDIVQAFAGIYAGNLFSPFYLDRLERIPGGVPRRKIGSGCIASHAEDPAGTSEDVNLHLKPLCFALAISEMAAGDDENGG
jgi:hypothetical protein